MGYNSWWIKDFCAQCWIRDVQDRIHTPIDLGNAWVRKAPRVKLDKIGSMIMLQDMALFEKWVPYSMPSQFVNGNP